jgi:hypothetical protein
MMRDGREAGHLAGVVLGAQGAVESVVGRHHWWTGRYRAPAAALDLSHPGEIRAKTTASQAA